MASPSDDEDLIRRGLSSDRAARRELARRLLSSIQSEVGYYLLRIAGVERRDPRQEVQDLVQDVLVTLFDHNGRELRRWAPERGRSLDSFVRLVARRRVARVLGQKRGNPWALALTECGEVEMGDDVTLLHRLENRNELEQVLQALHASMNTRDHELFELLYVRQVAVKDAAKHFGTTSSALNVWSYRIRKRARELAGARFSGPRSGSAAASSKKGARDDV